MNILSMTATFGKLDRAELRLEPRLNVIHLPNEGGKSTWSAFLLAMFYGIDTSERASKDSLPDKMRYKPWSGAAMEGRMELEWQGKKITIERRTKGRVPMGEFLAYETESGLPVRELTAENCGLRLLGVEKAVFERSAFLRQSALAVTKDGALERRLTALATTGEETVSYSETERRLRNWKNACRHNKTGILPELERQLEAVEQRREQIRELQRSCVALQAREEPLREAHDRLERGIRAGRLAEQKRRQDQVRQAQREYEVLLADAQAKTATAKGLPDLETLRKWRREWEQIAAAQKSIPPCPNGPVSMPILPNAFAGKNVAQIAAAEAETLQEYDRLRQEAKQDPPAFPWLSAFFAVCTVLAGIFTKVLYALLPLAAALATAGIFLWKVRKRREQCAAQEKRAIEILKTFQVESRSELQRLFADAQVQLSRYEMACEAEKTAQEQYRQAVESAERRRKAYLTALEQRLPHFSGDPVADFEQAEDLLRTAAEAEKAAKTAERHLQVLSEGVDMQATYEYDAADLAAGDRMEMERRLKETEIILRQIRSQWDQQQGKIESLGDPAALGAEQEMLLDRIEEAQQRSDALELSLEVLTAANDRMQARFAPEISRRAAAIFEEMTGGRYDKVFLDQNLKITARESGEVATRELNRLSRGTGDQLYVSLRLAISRTLLPEGTPLVLDDALVNFDDVRLRETLDMLWTEAEGRQILLFTCQNREKAWAQKAEK